MKQFKLESEWFKAALPEDQVGEKTIRHRLAAWYVHRLPEGQPLLG